MSIATPPTLMLVFNRPVPTQQVFARVREAKPAQLFVASDGPRNAEEKESVEAVRRICAEVDWDCEVHTLHRDENLGCERAVSQAISWFYDHVDRGVILEDDCLPNLSFFRFCGELLHRYHGETHVGAITGNNFQRGRIFGDSSYYFSKHFHCWGWASWASAWKQFDFDLANFDSSICKQFSLVDGELDYWSQIHDGLMQSTINSWAYRWQLSLWQSGQCVATPQRNLVKNIGYGADATHTKNAKKRTLDGQSVEFPLQHPAEICINRSADLRASRRCLRLDFASKLKRRIKAFRTQLRVRQAA